MRRTRTNEDGYARHQMNEVLNLELHCGLWLVFLPFEVMSVFLPFEIISYQMRHPVWGVSNRIRFEHQALRKRAREYQMVVSDIHGIPSRARTNLCHGKGNLSDCGGIACSHDNAGAGALSWGMAVSSSTA